MTGPLLAGVRACVFDTHGTLFDAAAAAARSTSSATIASGSLSCGAMSSCKTPGCAPSRTGMPIFWQVTRDALDFALETLGLRGPGLRERLMRVYLALDPFPEVPGCCSSCVAPG
jgi:2-haloacid dehalogenase